MGEFDCHGLDTIIASPVLWVTGDVDNEQSLKALTRFCKGDSSVLLGTYESCGRCHCVPEASGVILFDDGPSHRAVMQVHASTIIAHVCLRRLDLHGIFSFVCPQAIHRSLRSPRPSGMVLYVWHFFLRGTIEEGSMVSRLARAALTDAMYPVRLLFATATHVACSHDYRDY